MNSSGIAICGAFMTLSAYAGIIVTGYVRAGDCYQTPSGGGYASYHNDFKEVYESATTSYIASGLSLSAYAEGYVSQLFYMVNRDPNASAIITVTSTQMIVLHSTAQPPPYAPSVFANFIGTGSSGHLSEDFNFFSLAGKKGAKVLGPKYQIGFPGYGFGVPGIQFDVPLQLVLQVSAQCANIAYTCRDGPSISFDGFTDYLGRPLSFDVLADIPEPSALVLTAFGIAELAGYRYCGRHWRTKARPRK